MKNVYYSFIMYTYTVNIFIPILLSLFITCFILHDVHESKWIYGCDFEDYSKWRVGKHAKGTVLILYQVHSKMYLETLNKRHDEPRWNSRPRPDCKNRKIRNTKQKLNWILNFMTRILNVSSSNFRCCTWYPNGGGGRGGGLSLTFFVWRAIDAYSSVLSST
jgi:hypothetical protein